MQQLFCKFCGAPLPEGTLKCAACGKNNMENDFVNVMIPNNSNALISYYLGICSLLCIPFLGIVAMIFGFKGLSYAKQNPEAKGAIHAWVGIILGGLSTLVLLMFVVCIIIGMMSEL